MSQAKIILQVLKNVYPGGISALDVFRLCGSLRASARIYDLRKSGHQIETYMKNGNDYYRLLTLPQ